MQVLVVMDQYRLLAKEVLTEAFNDVRQATRTPWRFGKFAPVSSCRRSSWSSCGSKSWKSSRTARMGS